MQNIHLTLVQFDIQWEDKKSNFIKIERLLEDASSSTDLILLPEMFSSGFTMNPAKVAEEGVGETVKWMMELTAKLDAAVCGSIVVAEGKAYYNRSYFVSPGQDVIFYDKKHLFSYGKESDHYMPGKHRVLIDYKGWKIMPFICYDLRFPVWMRNTEEVDLYIGVANWPQTRIEAWDLLLRSRAIENQVYVAAVNRIGDQPGGLKYNGHSAIIGFDGAVLEFSENEEVLVQCELDRGKLQEFRKDFRFLEDRDHFELV